MARQGKLIVVCGLPGAGKTTHARGLEERLGAFRFCPDEWMESLGIDLHDEAQRAAIEALQWRFAREMLRAGLTVVIEWGTWGRAERDTLREGARAVGAAVELHVLAAPVEVLYERIQRRNMESPAITREQLARWAAAFQEPTPEELARFDPRSD